MEKKDEKKIEKTLDQNELEAVAGGANMPGNREKGSKPITIYTQTRFDDYCPACKRDLIHVAKSKIEIRGTCRYCNKIWVYNGQ